MIIITGTITASADSVDQLIRDGLEHSRRSRLEPGCISHQLTRDVEDPCRLVFHERWSDIDAVRQHFAVPASGAFVRSVVELAAEPPSLELFDVTATTA